MATAMPEVALERPRHREVDAYLALNQRKSLLRILTCGSVDDGKSTLIGRLLYDSKILFEDQLAALESESRKVGTQGDGLDFALLVDGLGAEREQGITIDVAYRFFATEKRKFVVADAPGHEQYTRNMVTGASTADLAIILIDARKGVITQTRRHSYLVKLLGIRKLVLAVNKMDLVGHSEDRFAKIVADYCAFASEAGIADFTAIPVSALRGDNITRPSTVMPWYHGPPLLAHLETVPIAAKADAGPFRMAVQWVNRPNAGFRGYAGMIASGAVRPGDVLTVLPSGQSARVDRIVTFDGDLELAREGQSVTLTLADELDCSRGDILVSEPAALRLTGSFAATLVWMSKEALVPGRSYWLKLGTRTLSATVGRVDAIVDVNALELHAGKPLQLNDIGQCEINLDRIVAGSTYAENRPLGGFILIDKLSHATVAAGMIDSLPRKEVVHERAAGKAERIVWITGVSRAERAGLAARMKQKLDAVGRPSLVLDEAVLQAGLSSDLGTGVQHKAENIRRAREVARLMSLAGVVVLVALEVLPAEAHPGIHIDAAAADQEGADEWVI